MHIVLVNHAPIPVFAYGGTERVVWDLGRQLVQQGHRLTYLVPAGSHCDFAQVQVIDPALPWRAQIPAGADLVHFQFDPGLAAGHASGRHPRLPRHLGRRQRVHPRTGGVAASSDHRGAAE